MDEELKGKLKIIRVVTKLNQRKILIGHMLQLMKITMTTLAYAPYEQLL